MSRLIYFGMEPWKERPAEAGDIQMGISCLVRIKSIPALLKRWNCNHGRQRRIIPSLALLAHGRFFDIIEKYLREVARKALIVL